MVDLSCQECTNDTAQEITCLSLHNVAQEITCLSLHNVAQEITCLSLHNVAQEIMCLSLHNAAQEVEDSNQGQSNTTSASAASSHLQSCTGRSLFGLRHLPPHHHHLLHLRTHLPVVWEAWCPWSTRAWQAWSSLVGKSATDPRGWDVQTP